MKKVITLAAIGAVVLAASATAGVKALGGTITADGSSTVGPYTTAAAEGFQKKNRGVHVTVGISGTGGGFERFCRDEIDLSDASRPMTNSEAVKCKAANIGGFRAFTVANDALTVVVSRDNTWATCLTVPELKKIWEPGSKVNNWNQVRSSFPDEPLKLFGPGTDSGTFDFFTEVINGKARNSRSDYLATENDNIIVQGVAGEKGGLGYFGFSYYEENADKLKLVKVDGGKGCTAPSVNAVQKGQYRPLARPLFIYAKRPSFKRPEVAAFIGYIFNNERAIAKRAGFISLTDRQLKKARYQYSQALKGLRRPSDQSQARAPQGAPRRSPHLNRAIYTRWREDLEREIKLHAGRLRLRSLGRAGRRARAHSTYFDAGNQAGAARRDTRYRVENGRGLWQLISRGRCASVELEGGPASVPDRFRSCCPPTARGPSPGRAVADRRESVLVRAPGRPRLGCRVDASAPRSFDEAEIERRGDEDAAPARRHSGVQVPATRRGGPVFQALDPVPAGPRTG